MGSVGRAIYPSEQKLTGHLDDDGGNSINGRVSGLCRVVGRVHSRDIKTDYRTMKVAPRREGLCVECSDTSGDEFIPEYTIQWLREVNVSHSRSCWGPRGVQVTYICSECGCENR